MIYVLIGDCELNISRKCLLTMMLHRTGETGLIKHEWEMIQEDKGIST